MNISQLKPASSFAQQFGAKILCYGAPGTGKTPICNTAPRPVLCSIEPGLLSMRDSNVPTWQAFTTKAIDEFFEWLLKSNETKNFDTVCIDSGSQLAEVYLKEEVTKHKDGRKVYGEMSAKVMKHMEALYFLPQKHVYIICKQTTVDDGGIRYNRPHFPGQDLNVKIPHLFDIILHLAVHNIPGYGQHKAFKTQQSFDALARDRSGKLSEYEQPNLTEIFRKATS